jgi:hypothetical protein
VPLTRAQLNEASAIIREENVFCENDSRPVNSVPGIAELGFSSQNTVSEFENDEM